VRSQLLQQAGQRQTTTATGQAVTSAQYTWPM